MLQDLHTAYRHTIDHRRVVLDNEVCNGSMCGMKTVGHDRVRDYLHGRRSTYVVIGMALIVTALILMAMLPFATFTVVFLFGVMMMLAGVIHIFAGFRIFSGIFRYLWIAFGVLYIVAGYFAFSTPVTVAIVLTDLLGIVLILAGLVRLANAIFYRPPIHGGWIWVSAILTLLAGAMIVWSPDAPFWILGFFLAFDLLFQVLNYLSFSAYIKHRVPQRSQTVDDDLHLPE